MMPLLTTIFLILLSKLWKEMIKRIKNIESKSTNVLTNEKDENGNIDVERKLSLSTAFSHNLQHVTHFQGLHKRQTCV